MCMKYEWEVEMPQHTNAIVIPQCEYSILVLPYSSNF